MPTGLGTPAGRRQTLAPALAGNPRVLAHPESVIKTLLHGLTGPIDGRTYAGGVMVPQGQAGRVGGRGGVVHPHQPHQQLVHGHAGDGRTVRAATASRTTPWTHAELAASVPTLLVPQPTWKATASHSAPSRIGMTGEPLGAFDFEGWTTGVPQQPGMWWQLELPAAQNVAEIHFYSPNGGGGGGGRGRGAGAANAAPPPPPQTTAPRGYHVQLSMDGTTWSTVAEGTATGNMTAISWTPSRARFLRITQTATTPGAPAWSMLETKLYARPAGQR